MHRTSPAARPAPHPRTILTTLFLAFLMSFLISAPLAQAHSQAIAGGSVSELDFPPSNALSWTFPNGFTLIVKPDRSAPVASVQVWCASGSIHEGKWLGAGLSHILEHMLFKGTKKRGANEISRAIQEQGGYINAYTSFDRTVYWIDIPKEGVAVAIDILADALLNSTLPEEEYVKEQEVIRREFAMGFDDPDRTISKLLFSTCFTQHPARNPVIGHLEIYNRLTRDDVLEYYHRRYVPNNLFMVVVGDVDPEEVRQQALALFGDRPRSPLEPIIIPEEPRQLGRREVHEEFATDLTRLQLAWPIPGVTHVDMPALEILAEILGGGRSSRLYRTIREKLALAHEVAAYSYTPAGPGLFILAASADPEKREPLIRELLAEAARIAQEKPSLEELDRAKRAVLAGQFHQLSTMRGQASDLGSNWLLARNLNLTRLFLDGIQAVSAEDVRRVAATYLREDSLNVVSLNPTGSLAAAAAPVHVPGKPTFQKSALPNGLRLLLLEDRRLPLVTLSASFRAGVLVEEASQSGISALLSSLLLKGTPSRDAEQIAKEIEDGGGSISSESGKNSISVRIDTLADSAPKAIEILADVLRNASLPETAIARERAAQLADIKAQEDQPTFHAIQQLSEALFGEHPYSRRSSGTPETVSSLTREQLLTFRDTHLRPENCVIAIAGAVDPSEVRRLVERHFADWNGTAGDPAPIPLPAWPQADRFTEMEIPKSQAILAFGYPSVSIFDVDSTALDLVAEASSDMGSRFFDRIREQMGLAYFVGASQQSGLAPGAFIFYLGTDPAKLEPVRKAMEEEIENLVKRGLTAEEFERARSKFLGEAKIRDQSNSARARLAALNEVYGLGFDHSDKVTDRVTRITLEEVNAAISRHLNAPRVISIVRPPPSPTPPTPPAPPREAGAEG